MGRRCKLWLTRLLLPPLLLLPFVQALADFYALQPPLLPGAWGPCGAAAEAAGDQGEGQGAEGLQGEGPMAVDEHGGASAGGKGSAQARSQGRGEAPSGNAGGQESSKAERMEVDGQEAAGQPSAAAAPAAQPSQQELAAREWSIKHVSGTVGQYALGLLAACSMDG